MNPQREASRSLAVRGALFVYSRALALLPRDFRSDFGAELASCFQRIATNARSRRGRGAVGLVLMWSLLDLATRAPREHLLAARAGATGTGGWSGLWLDLRQAARRLIRRPTFTVSAVLALGLGIAASTSVFSLVHNVVMKPLPYPASDELVVVDHGGTGVGIDRGLGVTYGVYRLYRERVETASAIAMYTTLTSTLTGVGDPDRLEVVRATPSLAGVLEVAPSMGRWFGEEEAQEGSAATTVLSHGLWRDRFGSDPQIIGASIELNGIPSEVIGVMPPDFAFPRATTELWVPRALPATGIGGWNEQSVARLAPGRTPEDLRRELAGLLPALREVGGDPATAELYLDDTGVFPRIVPLKENMVGSVRATLWILLGAVGVVLLIAVANTANLFLVRAEEGQRDSVVRAALGAGRLRLLRAWLAETLLLSSAAAGVGIAGAFVGVTLLKRYAPVEVPRLGEVQLHAPALAVALGTAALAGLALGLIPAIRSRGSLAAELKHAGRATGSPVRLRGRNFLMAMQVALALVLLISSGLLFQTFRHMGAVDFGFSERQALLFDIGLPESRYETESSTQAFHAELRSSVAALPGVESVGSIHPCLPLSGNFCWGDLLEVEGRPVPQGEIPPVTGFRVVTGDYFQTMGIPVRGRPLEVADEQGNPLSIVLSEAAAEAYFPGGDPIGRRVGIEATENGQWYTVVGVAADVQSRVTTDEFRRLAYLPAVPDREAGPELRNMTYVVRTSLEPEALVSAVRGAVAGIDPGIPLVDARTLESVISDATAPTAFTLALVGIAALAALLLGIVGVYGVVAYAVSQRTNEIGVRMALGARADHVRWMVLRQGGAVVGTGVALGLAAALGLTRLMRALLFEVSPSDPATYAALTAILLTASALALWFPARRASRVSPMEALRRE
jgi:putative ABC transport system permease protein